MSQTTPDTNKRLALSIIDFLNTSLKDGSLTADDAENVEVATTCIADAFKVDPTDQASIKDAVGSQPLLNIFSVYEKMKGKGPSPSTSTTSSASQPAPASGSTAPQQPIPEAEKLKSAGNAAMQKKDYQTAIENYTQAISYSPTNPIYLSNRAAAYSASGDHAAAAADAEIAVAADPKYTKAWSRLGLAKFAMGDAKGSVEAYEKGIEYEGSGGSEAMKKGLETAKKELARMEAEGSAAPEEPVDEGTRAAPGMPDLSSLASMLGGGGAGGAGGGGGMPDLAGLMSNPMFAGMARNLMSNPEAMSSIMNNPMVRNMMNQRQGGGAGGGGGGMPDMSQIQQMMQDPNLANL